MVKMFVKDPFSNYIYQKQLEGLMARFKKETRFPCYSVGKLTYACNRRNFYGVKDMFDGVFQDFDREGIVRMTMGQIMHDSFELSPKAEWHLAYNDIYGHIDEYFPDTKILMEKKTTMNEIKQWKQTLNKAGGDRFRYLPGEEWENQLRYYYLLIQKGKEVHTDDKGKKFVSDVLANPKKELMVRRTYVLYYCSTDIDSILQPFIIPVPMNADKWNLDFIEEELFSKKQEIEDHLLAKSVPARYMSPFKCPYCPYMLRCFHTDTDDEEIPADIKQRLGKRTVEAKAMEMKL